jgi:hypothetical protein
MSKNMIWQYGYPDPCFDHSEAVPIIEIQQSGGVGFGGGARRQRRE